MTTERGTKELVVNGGAVFVLFEYITGRDKREIERIYLDQAQISSTVSKGKGAAQEGTTNIGGISGSVNQLMQDKAIQCVVKEVRNGEEVITDKAAVLDFLLDLPATEYEKLIVAINEITDPKAPTS